MNTFTTINYKDICELINNAKERVIYVAPGISNAVSEKILQFGLNNGYDNVEIVIDSNSEVCRLGYGNIEAVEMLLKNKIILRKCNGIRISIIICDNKAFIYSPTPLLIEEPSINSPNAIAIEYEQAEKLIFSICHSNEHMIENNSKGQLPILEKGHSFGFIIENDSNKQLSIFEKGHGNESTGISTTILNSKELQIIKEELNICPPQKFNLARRIRVYNGYVQFVELKLTGCNIGRHTITIPSKLLNVVKNPKDAERLKATYKLLGDGSKVTGKEIDEKVNKIRKKYIKSLGSRFGSVILKQKKEEFLKEIDKAKEDLDKFREDIEKKLTTEFNKCKKELIKVLTPGVIKNPPDDLSGGILTSKPTSDQAKQYLENELNIIIPNVNTFVQEMTIQCDFKDVTYDMLKEKEFFDALKRSYKYIDWPNPFEEYEAAKGDKN